MDGIGEKCVKNPPEPPRKNVELSIYIANLIRQRILGYIFGVGSVNCSFDPKYKNVAYINKNNFQ